MLPPNIEAAAAVGSQDPDYHEQIVANYYGICTSRRYSYYVCLRICTANKIVM